MVVATDVETEDGHRVACQQWALKGNAVVYHRFNGDRCEVACNDLPDGRRRVVVPDRLVGWTNLRGDTLPIYAPHWKIDGRHDLEILDLNTGNVETVLTAADVRKQFPKWIDSQFGDGPIAIFLPALSPDGTRIFFKLARPMGGHFRSNGASKREGLFVFDLEQRRLLSMFERWGHPTWHADSRHLINVPNVVQDTDDGTQVPIAGLPSFPGSHPSFAPDGVRVVTDSRMSDFGGTDGEWGIVVTSVNGHEYEIIHRFDNSGGATSWRPPHPHPIFSPDGKRIYFNRNSGRWTRVHVASL